MYHILHILFGQISLKESNDKADNPSVNAIIVISCKKSLYLLLNQYLDTSFMIFSTIQIDISYLYLSLSSLSMILTCNCHSPFRVFVDVDVDVDVYVDS